MTLYELRMRLDELTDANGGRDIQVTIHDVCTSDAPVCYEEVEVTALQLYRGRVLIKWGDAVNFPL